MTKLRKPTVLIVDDHEDQSALKEQLNSTGRVLATLLHPNDVGVGDLQETDLLLIDYQLNNWPERDALAQISLTPPDGLALASVLRRRMYVEEKESPTAIAILTGNIDKLARPLPPEHREHILAHINNLEWVFPKASQGDESSLASRIIELACGVASLPAQWETENTGSELYKLLAVDSKSVGSEIIAEEVEACVPPIHELSEWNHGLAVLRWLLHRILPYPCFLWDTYQLAARLTLDHKALLEALTKHKPLRSVLEDSLYKGILNNFLGPRWWRSRVEYLLWEITEGQSSDPNAVRQRFFAQIGLEIPASEPAVDPIVCINTNYQPLERFYSIQESVRIRPDDWPAFADQPWTTLELARSEPKLSSLVLLEDRDKLQVNP
jgi:hypothetical protein